MSVLVVCGAGYVAGKEIMVLELTRGLRTAGLDARVAMSSWNDGDFVNRLAQSQTPAYMIPLGFFTLTLTREHLRMSRAQLLKWPALLWDYRRILREMKPHTVIHTSLHHMLLLWPLLSAKRDVLWLHDAIPDFPRYRRMVALVERRLRGFVTVSYSVARSLARVGASHAHIKTIHNGLTDLGEASSRTPNSRDKIVLGIVGQVGQWKGHDDLFHAFGQIAATFPKAELHVFGNGSPTYMETLKDSAARLKIAEKIAWRGFVKDRAAIFADLDICVAPSRSDDPLPTVAIEASAFGIPVIATRRGGLPEIIDDGVTGILVDSGNIPALGRAMTELLQDSARRQTMGNRARERMRTHFSSDRFIRQFVDMITEPSNGHSATQ